jgi:Outer membrane protein beta-barrel domain
MRGHLSAALLAFSALLIHSEDATSAADFARHSEGIGIKLGLTASGVRGSCPPQGDTYQLTIAGSSDPLPGLTGGLFWSYAFTPGFSIQTELQLTQGGTDGNLYAGTIPIPDGTVRLRYFELAVLPKMHFLEHDRRRYSAYAGLTAGYQIGDEVTPGGSTPQVENFQYGLGIGAIWDRDSDRFSTLVDLRYTTSFNGLQPSKSGSSIKNQALTLSVGVTHGSRRARGQNATEHTHLEWKLDAAPDDRIRVDLKDGSKMEGTFVRYEPSMLTASHLRPWVSKRQAKPDSVSAAPVDTREVGIPMEGVKQLFVHKGEARKGALFGAAFGAVFGAIFLATQGDEFGGGAFPAGFSFLACTTAGAIFGGIDHWVDVYP